MFILVLFENMCVHIRCNSRTRFLYVSQQHAFSCINKEIERLGNFLTEALLILSHLKSPGERMDTCTKDAEFNI